MAGYNVKALEDDKYYEIKITRAVTFGGKALQPGSRLTMKGRAIKKIEDKEAITDARPVSA